MKFPLLTLMLTLGVTLAQAQQPNFSGSWKAIQVDPPKDLRNGRAPAGGGEAGPLFDQAPQSITITQTATMVTVQIGDAKETFTLDDKLTVVPPNDVLALKTHAHWDGRELHLHYKQGTNWGRDKLTLNGDKLKIVRDIDSPGGSFVFTITYAKS